MASPKSSVSRKKAKRPANDRENVSAACGRGAKPVVSTGSNSSRVLAPPLAGSWSNEHPVVSAISQSLLAERTAKSDVRWMYADSSSASRQGGSRANSDERQSQPKAAEGNAYVGNNRLRFLPLRTKSPVASAQTTKCDQHALTRPSRSLSLLQQSLSSRLEASEFRRLNQWLYNQTGCHAFAHFDPDLFHQYHEGYRRQVKTWKRNPLDLIEQWIRERVPQHKRIADFGCGEGRLAMSFQKRSIMSFDLVAARPHIQACDITQRVPLGDGSIDVAVFCLSLMSTDWPLAVQEAHRCLVTGGLLKLAEVQSRITRKASFVKAIESLGFRCKEVVDVDKFFLVFEFSKCGAKCVASSAAEEACGGRSTRDIEGEGQAGEREATSFSRGSRLVSRDGESLDVATERRTGFQVQRGVESTNGQWGSSGRLCVKRLGWRKGVFRDALQVAVAAKRQQRRKAAASFSSRARLEPRLPATPFYTQKDDHPPATAHDIGSFLTRHTNGITHRGGLSKAQGKQKSHSKSHSTTTARRRTHRRETKKKIASSSRTNRNGQTHWQRTSIPCRAPDEKSDDFRRQPRVMLIDPHLMKGCVYKKR